MAGAHVSQDGLGVGWGADVLPAGLKETLALDTFGRTVLVTRPSV